MKFFVAVYTVLALTGCQGPQPEVNDRSSDNAIPGETSSAFLDPLVVDPDHFTLELENDYVRVLRERLPANVQGAMHSHRDRVSIYLNAASVVVTPLEGESFTVNLKAESIAWGDATTHSGTADADVDNISVELRNLHGEFIDLPESDATKTDPEHHVIVFENDRVRVLRITYPAGYKTPVHTHLPSYVFSVNDYRLEDFSEGEEPRVIDVPGGIGVWLDSGAKHASKNLGDVDAVVWRVEVKQRP